MYVYEGVEKIDPIEREKQHALTKALWQQLGEMGIKTGDKGRIEGFFTSTSYEQAVKLQASQDEDFKATVYEDEESPTYMIQITTPVCRLSIEALVELADIFMMSAVDTQTTFDGFQLDVNEIKKLNAPWWKIW